MMKFSSVNEALDFAIAREEQANLFYTKLADMAKRARLVKIFRDLASEELEHKKTLEAVKAGKATIGEEEIRNLNIADYLLDVEPHPDMNYTEMLVISMKKENLSYQLYTNLAAISSNKELRNIFLKLAEEEAEHKLKFEKEYESTKL